MSTVNILLLDDSTIILNVCAKLLKHCNMAVRTATSAAEGIRNIVEHGVPHVVVTDINMPGMSGLELTSRLRQVAPGLPIIIMTSGADKDLVRTAKELGVNGWLIKPFTAEQLIGKVTEALASQRQTA
ncbi:response regulator [Limnobacter sp.]|uniref:response regulator n=1 Tax=Limnobacter sp. TaxID=2003368 RepID=UPI003514B328